MSQHELTMRVLSVGLEAVVSLQQVTYLLYQ